jgi:FlaA1/EpsC-like NDP-sugar epimerase
MKQYEMKQTHPEWEDSEVRYVLGDVRDFNRLRRSMEGVDVVVHAAAMKQIPACENHPGEAVLTNVAGAQNVIDAALDASVKKVMALSTDKAVSPTSIYGATKLVSEKLMVQANAASGGQKTRFSCVRYGNVVDSRGGVMSLFKNQRLQGRVTVTDPRMTRFWIEIEQGVSFVIRCIQEMHGGEVFVPRIPSMNIMDLVEVIAPNASVEYIGIRPGDKLTEKLVSEDEARDTLEFDDMFVILPPFPWQPRQRWATGRPLADGFSYGSDNAPRLKPEELATMLGSAV